MNIHICPHEVMLFFYMFDQVKLYIWNAYFILKYKEKSYD